MRPLQLVMEFTMKTVGDEITSDGGRYSTLRAREGTRIMHTDAVSRRKIIRSVNYTRGPQKRHRVQTRTTLLLANQGEKNTEASHKRSLVTKVTFFAIS